MVCFVSYLVKDHLCVCMRKSGFYIHMIRPQIETLWLEGTCMLCFFKKKNDSFSPRYVYLNVCICIMGTQYPKKTSRRHHIPWNWSYGPHVAAGAPWRCREGPVEEWWALLASEPPLRPLRILLSLLLSNAFQKGLQCISFPSKLQGSSCPLVCSRHGHSKSWQHK